MKVRRGTKDEISRYNQELKDLCLMTLQDHLKDLDPEDEFEGVLLDVLRTMQTIVILANGMHPMVSHVSTVITLVSMTVLQNPKMCQKVCLEVAEILDNSFGEENKRRFG